MVEIDNLCLKYPGDENSILENVCLEIGEGECVLLTGESGSGKSSIINSVNGLSTRYDGCEYSGDIFINGENTDGLPLYEISKMVSSVFQNPKTYFFNVDTTLELLFFLENIGISREEMKKRLDNMLEVFPIEHLLDRDIFRLSGGEKQILCVAATYISGSSFIVLDEPSSNLDEKYTLILADMLKKLKAEGITILIAEHRIYYLMDIVDRVMFIKDGQIKREFTGNEFSSLSKKMLYDMGIRNTLNERITADTLYLSDGDSKSHTEKCCRINNSYINNGCDKNSLYENISDKNASDKNSPYSNSLARNTSDGLYIKRLYYRFPYSEKHINVEDVLLEKGKIYGITGYNGCGKSTFIKSLIGVLRKSEDEIYFDGRKLSKRKRIKLSSLVMQDVNHQLFSDSVNGEVELGIKNVDENKRDRILDSLGLKTLSDKHPMSLSGGQKQRVAIASVMMADTPIVCFDEPTSGMDYKNMTKISSLIKSSIDKNKVFLIISHDNEFLNMTVDGILDLGRN